MVRKIIYFFDKFEDKIRAYLSKYPIWYALVGGVFVVLFWRGVWHTADIIAEMGGFIGFLFYEPVNLLLSIIVLLATGLFVSFFIGDTILITGLKKEKKITERTEAEVREEADRIKDIRDELRILREEIDSVYADVEEIRKSKDKKI